MRDKKEASEHLSAAREVTGSAHRTLFASNEPPIRLNYGRGTCVDSEKVPPVKVPEAFPVTTLSGVPAEAG